MSFFDQLLAKYPAGSKVDTDGFPASQPYQCFDLGLVYIRIVANSPGLYVKCSSTGYVKDWYNDFDTNGLSQWFDRLPWSAQGQRGDLAIWGNAPATPSSHVAILEADNGTTEAIYGQNQPSPYTTTINLTSTGLLGFLRPKANTSSNTQGGDMSAVDTIKSMYLRLLGRAADDGGIATYTDAATKKGWEFVYNDLKNSKEGQADWAWRNPDAVRALEANLASEKQKSTGLAQNVADLTGNVGDLNKEVASLQSENSDLAAKLATQNTGDAGVKPSAPVTDDFSWVDKLQQWLRGIFK